MIPGPCLFTSFSKRMCVTLVLEIKSLLVKGGRTIALHQEERGLLVFLFNCMKWDIEEMATCRKIHFININQIVQLEEYNDRCHWLSYSRRINYELLCNKCVKNTWVHLQNMSAFTKWIKNIHLQWGASDHYGM